MTIPSEVLDLLSAEADGLAFGSITLEIKIHDGRPRFEITRRRSIVPGKPSSGADKRGPE